MRYGYQWTLDLDMDFDFAVMFLLDLIMIDLVLNVVKTFTVRVDWKWTCLETTDSLSCAHQTLFWSFTGQLIPNSLELGYRPNSA